MTTPIPLGLAGMKTATATAQATADAKVAKTDPRFATSDIVRGMPDAAIMSSPPTITEGVLAGTISGSVLKDLNAPNWRVTGGPKVTRGSIPGAGAAVGVWDRSRYNGTRTQIPYPPYRADTILDSPVFEVVVQGTSVAKLRVFADGVPVSGFVATTATDGSYVTKKYDFGARKPRWIVVESELATLGGVRIGPTDTAAYPAVRSPRVCWVGDSYAAGFTLAAQNQAWIVDAFRRLGIFDVWQHSAVSGTGFVKRSTASDAGLDYGNYLERLPTDVIPYDPDIVFLQGSINDQASVGSGAIGTNIEACVTLLRAMAKPPLIVITSPTYVATPLSPYLTVKTEVKAKADALGIPFVDLMPVSPAAPWFYGTGNTGTPTGDGNADVYRGSDTVHPNLAGAQAYSRLAPGVLAAPLGLRY